MWHVSRLLHLPVTQTYYAWQEQFFETGTPVFIYSKDIDYLEAKDELIESNYLLRNASYLDGSAYDWHLPFWQYADALGLEVNSSNYYTTLNSWLNAAGNNDRFTLFIFHCSI